MAGAEKWGLAVITGDGHQVSLSHHSGCTAAWILPLQGNVKANNQLQVTEGALFFHSMHLGLIYLFIYLFIFLCFLGPHLLQHMEVPRLGAESEL